MQVAQTTGSFLHIRLPVAEGILIFAMPQAGGLREMLAEFGSVLREKRGELGLQSFAQAAVARQIAAVQQADPELDVLFLAPEAFIERAHGVIEPQSGIPKQPDELGENLPEGHP